jgi:F420-dependent oxidoreductase-like protein
VARFERPSGRLSHDLDVKLGLQIPSFTWPGGPAEIGPRLADIARAAEAAGYDSIWVMDHFLQIKSVGAVDEPMLEAYTTLGYLAAHTSRAKLGTLVTGVTYRNPAFLVKQVTALDVLSEGRAWLGIGAAWFERDHRALGLRLPPPRERLDRLEEAIKLALQMWSEDEGKFDGTYYRPAETLNSPQSITRPHPPILIGGSGEQRTLRLVARYADACNLFGNPELVKRRLDVLRRHCEAEGRDYDHIEKTVHFSIAIRPDGTGAQRVVDRLKAFSDVGIQTAIGSLSRVETLFPIEVVGREIVPAVADL